ncbi:MAG: response regulator [Terriglobales bacterium]
MLSTKVTPKPPYLFVTYLFIFTIVNVGKGGVRAEEEMPFAALVVDDSMLIRHTICRFLEDRGFSVEPAANGLEALDRLKQHIPDVIITDMDMPKMGGGALIRALKRESRIAGIPIIALTRKSGGLLEGRLEADFAIFKDIDIEDQLARALEAVLGEKAAAKPAAI